MEVYTLWSGFSEHTCFHGVFSTVEEAEKVVMNNWKDWARFCWIGKCTIDRLLPQPGSLDVRRWQIKGHPHKPLEMELIPLK